MTRTVARVVSQVNRCRFVGVLAPASLAGVGENRYALGTSARTLARGCLVGYLGRRLS